MVDADETEARVQAAVEKTEAHRRAQASAQVGELQARREAERARQEKQQARHEAERGRRRAHRVVDDFAGEEAARAAWSGVKQVNGSLSGEEPVRVESQPQLQLAVKEERRSAKEAARLIAALEKKEARERKALAKAAARRKPAGSYRS